MHTKQKFFNEVNSFLAKNSLAKIEYIGDISSDIKKFKNINFTPKMPYPRLAQLLRSRSYKCALVPLGGEDDFDVCKSPIKYFQNAIFKIPGIYSNKKIYSDVIESDINGILVDNVDGNWCKALERLFDLTDIRNSIIEKSFDDVSKNHTYDNLVETYRTLFS